MLMRSTTRNTLTLKIDTYITFSGAFGKLGGRNVYKA